MEVLLTKLPARPIWRTAPCASMPLALSMSPTSKARFSAPFQHQVRAECLYSKTPRADPTSQGIARRSPQAYARLDREWNGGLSLLKAFSIPSQRGTSRNARSFSTPQGLPQSQETTVARGTAFEHTSKQLLYDLFGMDLQRVGGAGDAGIDLQGWWYLPDSPVGPSKLTNPQTPASSSAVHAEHAKNSAHAWNGYYDSPEHFAHTVRGRVSKIMQCFPKPFHGTFAEAVKTVQESGRSDMRCREVGLDSTRRTETLMLYRGAWQLTWVTGDSEGSIGDGDYKPALEHACRQEGATATSDTQARRLRVVAQCKAESKPLGPVKLRELEGTLGRVFQDAKKSGTDPVSGETTPVGVLVSLEGFSKQTMTQAMSSAYPILLLHLQRGTPSPPSPSSSPSPTSSDTGSQASSQLSASTRASVDELRNASVSAIMMNQALSGSKGPLAGRLTVRWSHRAHNSYPSTSTMGKAQPAGRPALFWDDKLLGKRGRERQAES